MLTDERSSRNEETLLSSGFEMTPLIHSIKDFLAQSVVNSQICLLYLRNQDALSFRTCYHFRDVHSLFRGQEKVRKDP